MGIVIDKGKILIAIRKFCKLLKRIAEIAI